MYIETVTHLVSCGDLYRLQIPSNYFQLFTDSWNERESSPGLLARFDFAFDSYGVPKLLELNTDTPVGLYEASAEQLYWESLFNQSYQVNTDSLHDKLKLLWKNQISNSWHFSCDFSCAEDLQHIMFLQGLASQAGVQATTIDIQDITWSDNLSIFIDQNGLPIHNLYKLYPWEYMLEDEYGDLIQFSKTKIVEPIWKWVLGNKIILTLLWERYPNHPNLLASFTRSHSSKLYVKKPCLSRAGQGIEIIFNNPQSLVNRFDSTFIYQEFLEIQDFDGYYPVVGSWLVQEKFAGISVREDAQRITGKNCFYVPHVI